MGEPIQTLSNETTATRRYWTSLPMTAAFCGVALFWTVVPYWSIPKFKVIFRDFGAELPRLTRTILMLADPSYVTIPALWLTALVFPVAIARVRAWSTVTEKHGDEILTITFCFVVLALSTVVAYMGMMQPFFHLFQTISGGPGKS